MTPRVGDKVQIQGVVTSIDGDLFDLRVTYKDGVRNIGGLLCTSISRIVERAETDAEKIKRLEGELDTLKFDYNRLCGVIEKNIGLAPPRAY